jgi:predicted RNase H-like nuclease (RuvC/YqgF family)
VKKNKEFDLAIKRVERETLGSSRKLQDAEYKFNEELNSCKRSISDKDKIISSLTEELSERNDEVMGLKVCIIDKK